MAEIYKIEADRAKKTALSLDIATRQEISEIVEERGPIDLKNTDAVKAAGAEYLELCRKNGVLPSVMGIASYMGCSRTWLYRFERENPRHPTTRYLAVQREIYVDLLSQAGLRRDADSAVTIFLLKNIGQMSDRVTIEPPERHDPFGAEVDEAALRERIERSIVIETEEDDE